MTSLPPRAVLAVAVTAAVPLLLVALAHLFLQISIPGMTRDVAAIADIHPLTGILSTLGILLWWMSAAIYLFVAHLLSDCQERADTGFLVHSGLLSAYFGFDDLFQFHEFLAPTYLMVPEGVVYGILACAVGVYLCRFRRQLIKPDGPLLLIALAVLSSSALNDGVLDPWLWRIQDWSYFVEDGLKWLGICFWTAFCIVRSSNAIRSRLHSKPGSR